MKLEARRRQIPPRLVLISAVTLALLVGVREYRSWDEVPIDLPSGSEVFGYTGKRKAHDGIPASNDAMWDIAVVDPEATWESVLAHFRLNGPRGRRLLPVSESWQGDASGRPVRWAWEGATSGGLLGFEFRQTEDGCGVQEPGCPPERRRLGLPPGGLWEYAIFVNRDLGKLCADLPVEPIQCELLRH